MAHIVYISIGMTSALNANLGLAERLVAAGHRMSVVSHEDIGRRIRARGFAFYRLERDRELNDAARQAGAAGSWSSIAKRLALRRRSIENDEVEDLIRGLSPDLLLVDMEMHFAVIATAGLNVPTVLSSVWFSVFKSPDLPPMNTDLLPAKSMHQRLRIRLAWWRLRLATLGLEWRRKLSRQGLRDYWRIVNYSTLQWRDLKALARARGYEIRREVDRTQWLRPYVYLRLPVICMNVWEMEFPHERHPNMHYVGPMVSADRAEAMVDDDSASKWTQLKQDLANAASSKPRLIYCSLGTFWSTDRGFLNRVVDVFRRRQDWQLVLGLGGKLDAGLEGELPDNVTALGWAPQMDVLRIADCAITHGGISTINECLWFEVPMVVYSTRHVDQSGCAARVAYHGLGIMADKDTDSSIELERNIERVLSNKAIAEKLAAMRATLRRYDESGAGVARIEAHLRQSH